MTSEKILEAIERQLIARELSSCERYIIAKSWEGDRYEKIARESGYDKNYIKQVGAKLWSELSLATGKSITKKNLRIVFDLPEEAHKLKQTIPPQSKPILSDVATVNSTLPQKVLLKDSLRSSTATQGYLASLHPILWTEQEDGACLHFVKINFPSSPVVANSPLYINRPPIEDLACSEIERPGCLLRIEGARKIGKSSLLNQIIAHASAKQYATVNIDFQEVENSLFGNIDKLLQWFCASITLQTGLPLELDKYWQPEIGSKVSCKIYLEYILRRIDRPVVVVINELNRLFEYQDVTKDFLSMLRFWHEQSKNNPLWKYLRLVLVYSTDVYVWLNLNQSPINVGLLIDLPLFTFPQTVELARRYSLDLKFSERELVNLYQMLDGHPHLTSLAFYHLHRETITLKQLIATAATPEGIFGSHLLNLLVLLQSDRNLISNFKDAIAAEEPVFLNAIAAHKLKSLGLVEYEQGKIKPLCQLYRLYFKQQLSH